MEIKHDDLKWMYKHLNTNKEVKEVSKYLEENNLTIKTNDTHDPQSGWNGEHVILEGRDLSGNGFCFNGGRLLNHVRNHKQFSELKESDEYKEYLKLKEKYQKVDRYFSGC